MPKLPGLGQREAVRALEKAGFVIIRQGKHITMSDGTRTVQVPHDDQRLHDGQDRQGCGLQPEQFRALL